MISKPKITVCVIGAGVCGLCTVKSCLESNLDVVCYEASNGIGGLWNYDRTIIGEKKSNIGTVMESTIVNTSKEMFAYSDFPPPADWPTWMHHSLVCKYLHMYAEHFDLLKNIELNTTVEKIEKSFDYDISGKWNVTANGKVKTFDKVLICSGHFADPYQPYLKGIETFEGVVSHSQTYKNWRGYENKNVLMVGIGNSSLDIACELGRVANKVYVSTRRGAWILSRMGLNGYPTDLNIMTRFKDRLLSFLPKNWINNYIEYLLNLRFDHATFGLKPKHRFLSQHGILSDTLPLCLASGTVIVKGDVKRFCKNSVIFEDDSEHKIDTVIFCTGYTFSFPFLEDGVVPVVENCVNLYKFVFPPHLPHPSLAMIGLVVPLGALGPVAEMQARWVAKVFTNEIRLPSELEMHLDIQKVKEFNERAFYKSVRHTLKIPFIGYMEDMAETFGAKPNLLKLFFTDHKLFRACYFGPCTSYTYRLNGPNSWSGARDAILNTINRNNLPLQTRAIGKNSGETKIWYVLRLMIWFCVLMFFYVVTSIFG